MGMTTKTQTVVDSARVYPDLTPIFTTTAGFWQRLAIDIANDTLQKMLAQNMDWKWNRAYIPAFLSVNTQQDYVTSITDLGWLEQAWRIDINNSCNNGVNGVPKPVFTMESVRDLTQTSYTAYPFNVSFIQNSLAFMGIWQPLTSYPCAYGVPFPPGSPIQQFVDKNGNILYLDSTKLGLGISSPGFAGSTISLPTPNPYGVSGVTQPFAAVNAPAGTQVTDGTVTWTVADPNAYAMRLAPAPPQGGLAWLIQPVYQKKPRIIATFQDTIPVPDELIYLYRQGFIAMMHGQAGSPKFEKMYLLWEEDMQTALRSADRERDQATMYPSESVMGGGPQRYGIPVGPAWPFEMPGFIG